MKKIILGFTLLLALLLSGCGTEETVTITYNTLGGTEIDSEEYELQSEFTLPDDPELEYKTFTGWYYEETFDTLFTIKDEISRDITLYAKFQDIPLSVNYRYGEAIGDVVLTKTIMGMLFNPPEDPSLEGYDFVGWFYNSDCTEELLDTDIVLESTTISGCFEIKSVSLKIYDLTDELLEEITITISSNLPLTLKELGYNRLFTDKSLEHRFDYNNVVTEDLDLYYDENGTIIIGTNIYTYNDVFMSNIIRPAMEAYALIQDVELLMFDSEYDQMLLNNQVDIMIEQGVDVLLINLVNPAAATTIINKAKTANIPLVFYMQEPVGVSATDYARDLYVGLNQADSGVKQGEMIINDWINNPNFDKNNDGIIDYVLIKGEPGHPVAEVRTLEVINYFTTQGYAFNQLAVQSSPTWSSADANDFMTDWISNPFGSDIELVICNNDGLAFGAMQAMQTNNVSIPIYGIDGLNDALSKVANGTMNGTVMYNGQGIAESAIDVAINMALGLDPLRNTDLTAEGESYLPLVYIDFIIVTIDNVDEYQ